MNGQKVFKFATSVMPAAIEEVLRRANLTIDDVQFIVPHQANLRIIKYAAKRMGLPLERFQVSIAHRGNSSSACIPMTLCDAYESGNIHPGDKVVLVGFGGGFTSGASCTRRNRAPGPPFCNGAPQQLRDHPAGPARAGAHNPSFARPYAWQPEARPRNSSPHLASGREKAAYAGLFIALGLWSISLMRDAPRA